MHFGSIISDQLVLPFYLHFNLCCGVTSCNNCGVMLGNYTIVQSCDFCNASFAQTCPNPYSTRELILCLQLHNSAVVRSLLKSYAILYVILFPRLNILSKEVWDFVNPGLQSRMAFGIFLNVETSAVV